MDIQEQFKIVKDQDIALLIQAFETSNQASLKLEEAYKNMKIKVEELNLQLEEKNEELERNLREKERVKNFLNNVLESLTDGVMAIDLDGRITVFNRSAEQITGYRLKDVEGRNYTQVLGIDFYKDFPQTDSLKNWAMQFNEETEIRTKSRSLVPVRASLSQIRDENQDVIGILIIFRDMSLIKGLEEQVKRTNVLSAMGEMAANIAHEVRNPLASIQLFAEILEEDLVHEPTKHEIAQHIVTAVKSLDHTVANLLLFTKEFSPVTRRIPVNDLVEESLAFARHPIQQNSIRLKKNLKKDLYVMADPELIKQVLLNLFLNAVQSMSEEGELSISSSVEKGKNPHYSCISVEDNGKGIVKKDLEKIFNPFYTTRKDGTGLGLAIAQRILNAHKGKIDVTSVPGRGTKFDIYLPA